MKGLLREFARYTSLNVLGMLALSCYILADTFFVSLGLGADGLAALNLAIPIYSFINGSGLMIGMGGGTRYSILRSQGNRQEADQTFTQALYLAGAFSLLFMATGALFAGDIVRLFGGTGQVFTMSRTYLRVILLFSPAFLMNNVLLCFVRNDGAPQLAMTAMIVGSLSNVVLDWVFIFPLGMGILGAVLATGWAPILSMAILSAHFWRKHNQFRPVPCKPQGRLLGRILSSGAPSLITEVSSGIVMIVFNTLILSLEGNIGVAAYGVIANLSLVVIAMFTGSPRDAAHPQPGLRAGGYQRPLFHPPLWAAHHCGAIGSYLRADGSFRPSNRLGVQQRKRPHPARDRHPRAAALLYCLPLCRLQRGALPILHLHRAPAACTRHLSAAGLFRDPAPGLWASLAGRDDGHLAGFPGNGIPGGHSGRRAFDSLQTAC